MPGRRDARPSGERAPLRGSRRRFLAAGAAGLAAVAAGCSNWGGDSTDEPRLAPAWTFSADRSLTPPTVGGGRVYAGCRDKRVYALDADSGDALWRYETGGPVDARPAVGRDRVFATSEDGDLYALDPATGRREWAFDTYRNPHTPPVLGRQGAYVGFWPVTLYGVDRDSGSRTFAHEPPDDFSTPAVADGTLYYDVGRSGVYAVDAATGERRWRHPVDHHHTEQPTVRGDTVFAGGANARDNWLYATVLALDRRTGERRWEWETKGWYTASPLVADGRVYVAYGDVVRAFDATTGETLWRTSLRGPSFTFRARGQPALDDGALYVAGQYDGDEERGRLAALDARTGEPLWRFEAGSNFYGLTVAGGRLYVTETEENAVYALPAHPESAPPLTTAPPE